MSEKTDSGVLKAFEKIGNITIDVKPDEDPKHFSVVAHLAASKADISQIALMTGLREDEISGILSLDRIQGMVREIHARQFVRDPQAHIRSLLPKAIEVHASILDDVKTKPELRLKAAEGVMDRAMGKAPMVMQFQGSAILALLDRLDMIQRKDKIKTIEGAGQKMDNEAEEGEIIVDAAQNSNPYQKWVDENT